MTLEVFIIAIVVLGIIFYMINRFIPMSQPFKTMLNIVGVVVLIYLVLALFHIFSLPIQLK
jgi:hypothetical protein